MSTKSTDVKQNERYKGNLPVSPVNIEDELTAVEGIVTSVSFWTDDGFITAITKNIAIQRCL